MSTHVVAVVRRHYHHHHNNNSSRFRSGGFTSVSPPAETQLETLELEPEHKKRKTCFDKPLVVVAKKALDPALWKSLPDDIFERVLSNVPSLGGLFRCRAVNKQCKNFVFSPRFQILRASVKSWASLNEQSQYLLLFATLKAAGPTILCTAYDSSRNRWLRMPPMQGLNPRAKVCIAGDGGLLCFRDEGGITTTKVLFIHNPVTQTCRELPPMRIGNSAAKHYTWLLTHMVYNSFTRGYKILVLLRKSSNNRAHMEVYDSGSETWVVEKGMGVLERKYKLRFEVQVGACSDNFFYFVAKEEGSSVTGLVVYDVFSQVFRAKLLYRCEPRCPNGSIDVQVVECKGKVLMVVREDDSRGGATKGVSFYTLNPCSEQKVEDSVLFESFFTKWGGKFPPFRCVSVRGGLGLLLCDSSFEVLADDLSDALKLPGCPFQGLGSFVHSSSTPTPWPLNCPSQNVISDARFQPNANVSV